MNEFAIGVEGAAAGFGAHVADHVPVQGALVLAAGLRVGVAPVITPLYSTDQTDNGVDDTTALDKKITTIVSANYAIR